MALIDSYPILTDTRWFAPPALVTAVTAAWAPPPSTATGSPVTTNCPTRISVPSQQSRHDIRRPPLDEGPPIEQAEQSKHLSHWQRYLANDAESERAAREMQVPCGRRHVDDFTHMASVRSGRHSLFRNQRLFSDSAGAATWSRNLCRNGRLCQTGSSSL